MQQSPTFNWATARVNALNAFESPQNAPPQQPAITIPPSAYDPTFFQTQFLGLGTSPNDPRAAVNTHQMGPSITPQHLSLDDGRSLWGAFTLSQGFSSTDGYTTPSNYSLDETTFQYLKLPSRHTLPIIPIYENTGNLFPEEAMPLTVRQPQFPQQSSPNSDNGTDWASLIMEDVGRLEAKSTHQNTVQLPLTLQSPSDLHSQAQARMQQQQPSPQHHHQQSFVHPKMEESPSPESMNQDDPVSEIYEATAFLHDFIAEDRLNNGAKEIISLPSAVPAFPSLSVRTPAPRFFGYGHHHHHHHFNNTHPYSSPRLAASSVLGGVGSPRLLTTNIGFGGLARSGSGGGSARSVRPIVRVKREPAPVTTAYLAGLRRPIPLSASALERVPEDPYPRANGISSYPLSIGSTTTTTNTSGANSTSTMTASLPSESPFSSSKSLIPDSPMTTRRGSIIDQPLSPTKESDGGSLRLHRGNSLKEQSRPSTTERLQTQSRATASRKRADDDIISVSFRGEEDWRRRAVLDNILAAQFLSDNVMEPINSGASDPLTMGMGPEGKSIYAVFLEQVERSQWRCLFGDKEHPCGSHAISFKRLERALDHVRSHLNHRPYVCKGECQKGETCDARFFARSHLQDHVKRTESACCETCGQVIRIQNMPRHRLAH